MHKPHRFITQTLYPQSCARCGMPKSHMSHVTKGYRRPRIHWRRIFRSKRGQWKVYNND